MNRAVMMVIVLLAYVIYAAFKHKEVWRKLTLKQIIGVLLTCLIMMGIGGTFLYYSSRLLMDTIPNEIVSILMQFISAIIVIIFGVVVFNIIVSKITNGVLPVKRPPS
ncbi:hypothetical protein GCM10011409_34210 [Lentibacillus populi]|uniref:Uncharacterized protein n=1 Tax=Lentibacillus populi TaxID=1827502 RepID=A0A9W5U025_9BACI|nr:hypothetical protein [Lentibacillus populi]MBT2216253.1 hypothetical protein [Virgibacillus dakarensis]GGB53728.1 hypothetical protein GCM10011409_34210 [Lentibacillus populi]